MRGLPTRDTHPAVRGARLGAILRHRSDTTHPNTPTRTLRPLRRAWRLLCGRTLLLDPPTDTRTMDVPTVTFAIGLRNHHPNP